MIIEQNFIFSRKRGLHVSNSNPRSPVIALYTTGGEKVGIDWLIPSTIA